MIRIAKESDPKRLAELKEKINNADYLNLAISSIAHTLTKEIVNDNEGFNG